MQIAETVQKPRIGLFLGDPGGIGAELVCKILNDAKLRALADILVLGDEKLLRMGERTAGTDLRLKTVDTPQRSQAKLAFLPVPSLQESDISVGQATEGGGRSVLKTLALAAQFAQDGLLDAICFAPLNKYAMRLGGLEFEDEIHFFANQLGHSAHFGEINVLESLWTTRVTSHIALKAVAEQISMENVVAAIKLAHDELSRSGKTHPKIGVAALNPHAGDGGIYGREEIEAIKPAVEHALSLQIAADGPYPSDTVFLKARDGQFDAVVTMYHDQGQIAMKLMGFERGVTVLGGLPVPITTAAHGTAYDIAGQGIANTGAMRQAFVLACQMAEKRNS